MELHIWLNRELPNLNIEYFNCGLIFRLYLPLNNQRIILFNCEWKIALKMNKKWNNVPLRRPKEYMGPFSREDILYSSD